MDANPPTKLLIPLPKAARFVTGATRIHRSSTIRIGCNDPRLESAWARFAARLPERDPAVSDQPPASVLLSVNAGLIGHRDGFRLRISRESVEIVGGSSAGCFYGVATLGQLAGEDGSLPIGEIVDEPDYSTRGLLHDVTRGKCPRLDTLKVLVDRLASLKINQLQLYIEHAFVFSFDPEICGPQEGLTPDEIRELDGYCRERFIDLVPAVATLGHMGRVLSMPRYRHLAEIEATKPWLDMNWLERMRGFTLDVLNPESRELVARIWSDIMDAFSCLIVNICGDEPWDLGRGKNEARLDENSRGEAYVDHIAWTHGFCAAQGRRTQLWGDVVRNYPHLLSKLPRDLTVLHWGYDDRSDYKGTGVFTGAGLDTVVCPGTSGWKRIINAMDLAERNILTFAKAGKRLGAGGLINTDWGDFGHFNQLACSWHGIALGAASAWNVKEPGGADFDRRLAALVLKLPSEAIAQLRKASAIAEKFETWRLLSLSDPSLRQEKRLPARDECAAVAAAAVSVRTLVANATQADLVVQQDHRELGVACRFTDLLADRLRNFAAGGPGASDRAPARQNGDAFDEAARAFAECWEVRNKPLRIQDILEKLRVPQL